MTKQRKLILEIVNKEARHLQAEDIFKEARMVMPNISLGTVYRNLGVLCEENLIKRIPTEFGYDVYDRSIVPHIHIICPRCKSIKDAFDEKIDKLLKDSYGKHLLHYDLTLSIICDKCITKGEN